MIIAMQNVHDKYRAVCQHLTLDRLSIVVDKTSASGAEIWDLIFSKLINFNLDQKQDVMKPQNLMGGATMEKQTVFYRRYKILKKLEVY